MPLSTFTRKVKKKKKITHKRKKKKELVLMTGSREGRDGRCRVRKYDILGVLEATDSSQLYHKTDNILHDSLFPDTSWWSW